MQKLASEFEKTNIITLREQTVLGHLLNVVINPDTGNIIGILFRLGDRKKKEVVVNIGDVAGLGANFIMIRSIDAVSVPNEIIRIKEVLDRDITITGAKVVDENGRHLGRVRDYSANFKTMRLGRLYVTAPALIKMIARELIIPEKSIIKIEKGKITVKNGTVRSKKKIANLIKTEHPRAKIAHITK